MTRSNVHSLIYFVLLVAMVVAIPTSNFLMSAAQIFLALNWIVEGQWQSKIQRAQKQPLLWAFVVLFAVHLIWILLSSNYSYAIDDIRKKLPFLIVPLIVLTSSPLSRKRFNILMWIYLITMFAVSLYSWINHIVNPDISYRSLFPFISHIRLALNACLVIFLLLYVVNKLLNNRKLLLFKQKVYICMILFLIGWFVGYLFLLQSYTGFIILLITAVVVCYIYIKRHFSTRRVAIFFLAVAATIFSIVGVVVYYTYDYYSLKPLSVDSLKTHTANGNAYVHNKDGFVEHGNYSNNYICHIEIEQEWRHISSKPLDYITPNGYSIEPTLIRYLNSKGLTKDSVGLSVLTENDIIAIEQGKASYYDAYGNVVEKMMYRLLFEYENYRVYHRVKNSSLLQRFELWKNTSELIVQNPIFGVGTGDVADAIHRNLQYNNSELKDTEMRTHNQYLTFILAFGFFGTLIITAFFGYAIIKQRLLGSLLMVAYLCIVAISFMSEDTLETAAGCLFCTFFFCVFTTQKECFSNLAET